MVNDSEAAQPTPAEDCSFQCISVRAGTAGTTAQPHSPILLTAQLRVIAMASSCDLIALEMVKRLRFDSLTRAENDDGKISGITILFPSLILRTFH